MQTKVMACATATTPYLEYFPHGAGQPERAELASLPLTIGRSNSADLTLPSNLVSREHARIARKGSSLVVRDLGSTNGTLLNGERIEEAVLSDGDVLTIADFELAFYCDDAENNVAQVTQVMEASEGAGKGTNSVGDFIVATRRLQAVLAHRAVRVLFQPIVALEGGTILGYRALGQGVDFDVDDTGAAKRLLATECRLSDRLRQLARSTAAQEAARLPGDLVLVLRLHPSEIGTDSLEDTLARLLGLADDDRRILLEVPDSAVTDIPYFRDFREQLGRFGLLVGYSRFSASVARVMEHQQQPPDYLRLDATLTNFLPADDEQAARVRSILEACREIGAQVIASGVETADQAETLRALGCPFALGSYFGRPQPVGLLVHPERADRVHAPAAVPSDTSSDASGTPVPPGFFERVFLKKAKAW